jgi:GT2 family glycosyltransferase
MTVREVKLNDQLAISVIIPTYNRKGVLRKTLEMLQYQTLPPDRFEVILVDDGSSDGTPEMVAALEPSYRLEMHDQANHGAAAARNLGAREARGEILLFLDSDMLASKELLASHLAKHCSSGRSLVVGPREELDHGTNAPFSKSSGALEKDYRFKSSELTFQEAFTCNLSVKSSCWSVLEGFDERFPASGYEDIDFAYRAAQAGFSIIPCPEARALHNHPLTFKQQCDQARNYHRSAALLFRKHPELRGQIIHLRDKEPVNWKEDTAALIIRKLVRRLLSLKPVLHVLIVTFNVFQNFLASRRLLEWIYWKIIGSYQLIGFREGIKKYGW